MLALISGALLAFIGWFFSERLLEFMGTPKDVIDKSTLYMQIYFLGSPASMLYNFGSAVLRSAGDTKRPLYVLIVAGVINVGLNLFCVITLKLGVVGVAIGTVASQLFSAVAVLFMLIKNNTEFKLEFKKLCIHSRELKKIAMTGIPSGINGVLFSASNVIIQSAINSFGKLAVAGATAATNIEVFGFLILSSTEQGVVSFVGQNMGAGKFDRVNKVTKIAMTMGIIGTVLFMVIINRFGEQLLSFFADKESAQSVSRMGMIKLTIATSSFVLFAPNQVLSGILKGMGRATESMVINAFCVCLLRVIWMFFIFPINPVLEMIYYSYPVTWGASSVAMIIAYFIVRKKVFKKEFYTTREA